MKTKIAFAIFFTAFYCHGQVKPVSNGIAIGGYDVVSYFKDSKAVKGNQQIAYQYDGVTYLFSSKDNELLFEKDPKKYLPQYDGYCALAVSYGKKISIDPQTFKIINSKLYLFYNVTSGSKKVNSLNTWEKNEPRLLKKADELWPDVKKKKFKEEEV